MNSIFFWLSTAAALGALVEAILGAGPLEILIVWGVLNGLYGIRSRRSARRSAEG